MGLWSTWKECGQCWWKTAMITKKEGRNMYKRDEFRRWGECNCLWHQGVHQGILVKLMSMVVRGGRWGEFRWVEFYFIQSIMVSAIGGQSSQTQDIIARSSQGNVQGSVILWCFIKDPSIERSEVTMFADDGIIFICICNSSTHVVNAACMQ